MEIPNEEMTEHLKTISRTIEKISRCWPFSFKAFEKNMKDLSATGFFTKIEKEPYLRIDNFDGGMTKKSCENCTHSKPVSEDYCQCYKYSQYRVMTTEYFCEEHRFKRLFLKKFGYILLMISGFITALIVAAAYSCIFR